MSESGQQRDWFGLIEEDCGTRAKKQFPSALSSVMYASYMAVDFRCVVVVVYSHHPKGMVTMPGEGLETPSPGGR